MFPANGMGKQGLNGFLQNASAELSILDCMYKPFVMCISLFPGLAVGGSFNRERRELLTS